MVKRIEIEDVSEPFCGLRRKNTVSLGDKEPEIAAEWVYRLNGGWTPNDFSYGSSVYAWWECPDCLREYKASINNRTSLHNRSGCPYCASKLVCSNNALSVLFPDVAAEWHPSKNSRVKATDVMHASGFKRWWLCSKCKHSWQAAPSERTGSQSGCPACYEATLEYARQHPQRTEHIQIELNKNSQEPSEWYNEADNRNFISLLEYSKNLSKQWHPTKNGKVKPSQIAMRSDTKAWWKCPKGADHEWQAEVFARTRNEKSHCPFCLHKRLSATNNLKYLFPDLAKEWHPTKNGKLKPEQVIAGGTTRVWWRCAKNKKHEWDCEIGNRTVSGRGCPYCSRLRVSSENSLAHNFPALAAQLHPTKNGNLSAKDIAVQSNKKVWWQCKKDSDHEWEATPSNRTGRGSGCPACNSTNTSVTNCLAIFAPKTAKLWDKQKNGKVTPKMVATHSKIIAHWRCDEGHTWKQSIAKQVASPYACRKCLGVKL